MTRARIQIHGSMTTIGILAFVLLMIPTSRSEAQESNDTGEHTTTDTLSQAITDYLNAADELQALKDSATDMETELAEAQDEVVELEAALGDFAAIAYTSSQLTNVNALLASGDTTDMIDSMTMLDLLGESRAKQLTSLVTRIGEIESVQDDLDDNIATQEETTAALEEARLIAVNEVASNKGDSALGPQPGDFMTPEAVYRDESGSLPYESCSEPDPTNSGGCLSPRSLHSLQQAILAGFTRYTACYRPSSWGEHGLGRACDFSVSPAQSFAGEAYGDDKTYGDNLAAWFVENADALGVQYVIWYRQIWLPGTGWTNYNLAGGEPNTDHTNHVHLSWR